MSVLATAPGSTAPASTAPVAPRVHAGADAAVPVGGLPDTITAGGGTVVTVIAHSADAGTAGTQVPPSTGARRLTGRH